MRIGVVRLVVVLVMVVVGVVAVVVGVVVMVEVLVVVVDVVVAAVVGGCGGLCECAQRWPNHFPGEHSRRYSKVILARLVRALSRVQLTFATNCTDMLPVLSVSVSESMFLAWRLLAPVPLLRFCLPSPAPPATGTATGGTTGAKWWSRIGASKSVSNGRLLDAE